MSTLGFIWSYLHFEEIISDLERKSSIEDSPEGCTVVDHVTLNLQLNSDNILLSRHANALGSIQKPFILRSRTPVELLLGLSI